PDAIRCLLARIRAKRLFCLVCRWTRRRLARGLSRSSVHVHIAEPPLAARPGRGRIHPNSVFCPFFRWIFMPRSIITIDDLSDQEMEQVFDIADDLLTHMGDPAKPYRIRGRDKVAEDYLLSTLFLEPSTLTLF